MKIRYSGRSIHRYFLAFAATAVTTHVVSADVVTAVWTGPASGTWDTPDNWSPNVVPANSGPTFYDVIIDDLPRQDTTVTMGFFAYIHNLTVHAGDMLALAPEATLTLNGTSVVNNGTIFMHAEDSNATVRLASDVEFTGSGVWRGSSIIMDQVLTVGGVRRLTNGSDHSIVGAMMFPQLNQTNLIALTNHGLIHADTPTGISMFLAGSVPSYNDGIIRASNGAYVGLNNASIDNTGGVMEALAGSRIHTNTNITGGIMRELDGDGAGHLSASTCTLTDLTIQGQMQIYSQVKLSGVIDQSGSFLIHNSGGWTGELDFGTGFEGFTHPELLIYALPAPTVRGKVRGGNLASHLTVQAEGIVRGQLQVSGEVENYGVFEATAGTSMQIAPASSTFHNYATVRATGGGEVQIGSGLVNNTGGLIVAETGSTILLTTETVIQGGTLRDASGASETSVKAQGFVKLVGVLVEGGLRCPAPSTLRLEGAVQFNGPLQLEGTSSSLAWVVGVGASSVLQGPGGTQCNDTLNNLIVADETGAHLLIAADHTIRGSARIGFNVTDMRNEGTVASVGTAGIQINPVDSGGFVNAGNVHAVDGNVSVLAGGFENQGAVTVGAGRTLARTGIYLQTAGITEVDGILSATDSFQLQGGTLSGNGTVNSPLVNSGGSVAPGSSAGVLSAGAGYTQAAAGTLSVEINGSDAGIGHDQLSVTGAAALAGTLLVSRGTEFVPDAGQQFTILTSTGARTGTFDVVESCDPVLVHYNPNSVTVEFVGSYSAAGDLNHDGFVDGSDLGALLGQWGPCTGACCTGDLNGDGIVDGADLGALLSDWAS